MIIKLLKKLILLVTGFMLTVTLILDSQYYPIEIFYKTPNTPFEGNKFYNPYKNYSVNTLKANFHSHSVAWMNLTNGAQQPSEIYKYYRNKGYDLISVSNYQEITRDDSSALYFPAYEHGFNLFKRHQLVINPEKVSFFEFPLIQNYDSKQQVINRLRETGGIIVLAHAGLEKAYTPDDMKYLKGYNMIEVFNHFGDSSKIWDAALTSGYPAWIVANDDCHNIEESSQTLNCWTRISPSSRTKEAVLHALMEGCEYGVKNSSHEELNYLDSLTVTGNLIKVYFRSASDKISFVSNGGNVRKVVKNTRHADYYISGSDNYVRVEAENGPEMIYLNPVIRYKSGILAAQNGSPPVNLTLTIIFRIIVIIINSANLFALLCLSKRFRNALGLSGKRSPVHSKTVVLG